MKDSQPYIAVRFLTFSGFSARWKAFISMGSNLLNKFSAKGLVFGKMLGSGAGSGFSIYPDWGTYAWFTVFDSKSDAEYFFKSDETYQNLLKFSFSSYGWDALPIKSHGTWNGVNLFSKIPEIDHIGRVAVLTRASIKKSQAFRFWWNVPSASRNIKKQPGMLFSKGVGEFPLIEQATLSLWNSEKELNDFAYKSREHSPMVQKTKKYNWYSEELFLRMSIIRTYGSNLQDLDQ
ncbi:MAG: Spheroidene monooxygenase [Owenweeksia sp. TMED14]|nr:MAG: Spheroidene monooxygenase [Owenweeksia sp. TMED14]|tara:strand:+ start:1280 stop:1981 length:702 start_codon:yes stop_codon:yes gene_type:complete